MTNNNFHDGLHRSFTWGIYGLVGTQQEGRSIHHWKMFMPGVFLRFYALSHLNLQRLNRRILTIGILFVCMMLTNMINKVKNFLAKGVGGSDKHFRLPSPPPPSYCLPLIFATTGLVWFFTHITILIGM